jgi:hypothetical protein
VITAVDLLAHLEAKIDAAADAGEEVSERLGELARFVREIAEAALVRGDEVTLGEARRLAAKLGPLFAVAMPEVWTQPALRSRASVHTCPRCGQRFRRPAGHLDRVGTLLCSACTGELLAGIRL